VATCHPVVIIADCVAKTATGQPSIATQNSLGKSPSEAARIRLNPRPVDARDQQLPFDRRYTSTRVVYFRSSSVRRTSGTGFRTQAMRNRFRCMCTRNRVVQQIHTHTRTHARVRLLAGCRPQADSLTTGAKQPHIVPAKPVVVRRAYVMCADLAGRFPVEPPNKAISLHQSSSVDLMQSQVA
jgi:hypothetical protein